MTNGDESNRPAPIFKCPFSKISLARFPTCVKTYKKQEMRAFAKRGVGLLAGSSALYVPKVYMSAQRCQKVVHSF